MRLVVQLNQIVMQKNQQLLKPPNVWCEVCIEASGGGGSFAQQGSLVTQKKLAICVSRTT